MHSDPVSPPHCIQNSAGQLDSHDGLAEGKNERSIIEAQDSGRDVEINAAEGVEETEGATDEDAAELNAEEEAEERRILPTPTLPSQREIDEHWIDHYPYRNWCGKCVEGRGREKPHYRTHDRRKIHTVVFDYCFF